MDATALIMITVPLFGPAVVALGFDLIWFCVIVLITVGIAGITPPVGMVLYALKGACPAVGMDDVYKGSIPFFTIEILVTILTIAFPAIALYLPSFITG
jgi:TRAP-type mannitol/chloroaromatic compound transport system permease large subunit